MENQQVNIVPLRSRIRSKKGRIRGNIMGTRLNMGGGRVILAPYSNNNNPIQKPKPLN